MVRNIEVLTYLNANGYDDADFYRMGVYEKFLEMRRSGMSVKATLLTMEQQGYGSVATVKRIRRRMEQTIAE